MKIALTGTKGIPNRYGGFEQFAEYLSTGLAARGYEVLVYNPSFHPYKKTDYKSVKIITKINPERIIGPAANIIYDYLCIKDATRRKADIILECGYASAVPALRLLNFRYSKLITHVDGMEWKRLKWNRLTRSYIKWTERKIISLSDHLVCDHNLIADYFNTQYSVNPACISFGADIFDSPDENYIKNLELEPYNYLLAITRLEPENNIESIMNGYFHSNCKEKLVIIGQNHTKHGKNIRKKYRNHKQIMIKESIYNRNTLNNLRYFSKAYFHGHSVGGSNPSLLEAMASGAFIIAHDNIYNRSILGEHALFFKSTEDIKNILGNLDQLLNKKDDYIKLNDRKIKEKFQWERIIDEYEKLFLKVLNIT